MPKTSKLPKYVYKQTVKGRTYYRFRQGAHVIKLPGHPGSADFHTAYGRLLAAVSHNVGRHSPESVACWIDAFEKSAEWTQLADGTQRDYRRYLNRLDKAIGGDAVASVEPTFVFGIRDKYKDRPSAANHAVAVLRTFFQWCKARKAITADPTDGIGKLRGGESYKRWEDEQIEQFRQANKDVAPVMCIALDIGVYAGQRGSDAVRAAWTNYKGDRLAIRQKKTKTELSIPVHPDFATTLDAAPRVGITILTTKTGRAYGARGFSRDFLAARKRAKLPDDLSFHGLRHTAASRLAELGATAPQIQAITGHKSLKQVEEYIRQARQRILADGAIALLPRREKC